MKTLFEKQRVAREYYDSVKPQNLVQGFEKLVLTDGVDSMFITKDFNPESCKGCAIFKFKVAQCNTSSEFICEY